MKQNFFGQSEWGLIDHMVYLLMCLSYLHALQRNMNKYRAAETKLRVRFFGKIQIRILVSKNGFCVSLPLGFMIRAFLWGTDPKTVHLSSSLPCKFTGLAIFSLDLA